MPRRHSWLQDYNYELDHGYDRKVYDGRSSTNVSPTPNVTVNININLGDIIDKIVQGMKPKEALEEAIKKIKSKKRIQLNENKQ